MLHPPVEYLWTHSIICVNSCQQARWVRQNSLNTNSATIVQLEGVGMRYGPAAEVLHDIDLRLPAGSFHFLVGPSGAGKSSLLRLLSLTQAPSRGRIMLFGRDVAQLDRPETVLLRRRIGVVFQDFRLLDHLTAF